MLLRLILHTIRVNAITLCAPAGKGSDIIRLADPLIAAFGIGRPIRIVLSHEVSIPFSWGVWKPAIVFPAAAREWPRDQQCSVLLHELAHIARWDYFVHILAEIVRALYWPNPAVWFAVRRNAVERERACDDWALRYGTRSTDYASHLLQIARSQMAQGAPITATTMAGEPGLVERIRSVMNKRLDRSPLRPAGLCLTVCLALLIALPLGALEIGSAQWENPAQSQLTEDLLHDGDPLARQRAAWWLGENEDRGAVVSLVESLGDESADVRLVAAWALGEIKDRDSIPALIASLEDEDRLVREMAALALGEIEDPAAIDPLVQTFTQEEEVRAAVVWALGEIEGGSAAQARKEAFAEWGRTPWENSQVWTGVLKGNIRESDDVHEMLGQLRQGDHDQRRIAALSLGHLGRHHYYDSTRETMVVVDELLHALRDPVPVVRAAAVWALDEINPTRSARNTQAKR